MTDLSEIPERRYVSDGSVLERSRIVVRAIRYEVERGSAAIGVTENEDPILLRFEFTKPIIAAAVMILIEDGRIPARHCHSVVTGIG